MKKCTRRRKRHERYGSFGLAAVAVLICVGWVSGQTVEAQSLRDKRVSIHMKAKTFNVIAARLMFKYDVPIGFEQSTLDNDLVPNVYDIETKLPINPKYMGDVEIPSFSREVPAEYLLTVDLENARLEDVMDSLVSQMRNYQWTINDGVVNIFPKEGRDPRLADLLERKVDEFLYGKGQPIDSIQPKIVFYLPMFQIFLDEYNIGTDNGSTALECESRGDHNVCAGDRGVNDAIMLKYVTFRELLNRITRIKRGGWALRIERSRRYDQEHEFLSLRM